MKIIDESIYKSVLSMLKAYQSLYQCYKFFYFYHTFLILNRINIVTSAAYPKSRIYSCNKTPLL